MRRIIVLTFVAALVAAPALAGDEREGWYVGVEGAGTVVGGNDLVLGSPYVPVVGTPGGDLVTMDYGTGVALGAFVGFRNPEIDCWISYWRYDEDADRTVESVDGFRPAWGYADLADDFANRLDGESNLQADLIDVVWSRPFAKGDRSAWSWMLGLRNMNVEQMTTFTSDLDPAADPPTYDDRLLVHSDASGIGLVAGLGASYHFTDRFWGSTSLKFGFLTGKIDSTFDEDADGDPILSVLDGADRNFRQTDLDTRINFNVVAGLDLYVGYQFKDLSNAYTEITYPDDVQEGLVNIKTSDITFSGVSLGVSYIF